MLDSTTFTQTVEYTWPIKNYSFVIKGMAATDQLDSPHFTIDTPFHKSEWRLQLYPKENGLKDSDPISIFLENVTASEGEFKGTFSISLIGEDKTKNSTKCNDLGKFNEAGYDHGWFDFNKLFVDDTLTIHCEISVVIHHNIIIKEIQTDLMLKQFPNKFGITCLEEQYSDVKIASSCGSEVPAHKFILSTQSDVFKLMFANKDKSVSIVPTNCKLEAVKTMLKFVYAQEVNEDLNETIVFDLLSLANNFKLNELGKKCVKFLEDNMNVRSLVQTIEMARRLDLRSLKEKAKTFIKENIKELNKIDAFASSADSSALLAEMIEESFS